MMTVLLLGDSIRIGYQEAVRGRLSDVAHVLAPEENCLDTRNTLDKLDDWLAPRTPDLVHVNLGLHDLKWSREDEAHQVPLEQYTQNVREILKQLGGVAATVIWATTTPVNEKHHAAAKDFDRFEMDVVRYNEAAVGVAEDVGVAVNPLFDRMIEAGSDEYLVNDGVHFTSEGYELLGEWVSERIREVWS